MVATSRSWRFSIMHLAGQLMHLRPVSHLAILDRMVKRLGQKQNRVPIWGKKPAGGGSKQLEMNPNEEESGLM